MTSEKNCITVKVKALEIHSIGFCFLRTALQSVKLCGLELGRPWRSSLHSLSGISPRVTRSPEKHLWQPSMCNFWVCNGHLILINLWSFFALTVGLCIDMFSTVIILLFSLLSLLAYFSSPRPGIARNNAGVSTVTLTGLHYYFLKFAN